MKLLLMTLIVSKVAFSCPQPALTEVQAKFDQADLDLTQFSGRTLRGNFYKCGDHTAVPHFLSWNPIDTPTPNFHVPECFGELYFE